MLTFSCVNLKSFHQYLKEIDSALYQQSINADMLEIA